MRHTVVPGDCLWDLAGTYYKNNFKWRRIADANPPPNVNDPHWIYPGQIIVIPDIEAAPAVEPAPAPVIENPEEEKEAPEAAEPEPEPEPEPAPAPAAPEPPQQPVKFEAASAPEARTLPDSLSARIPEGMTGQQPSLFRMIMPKGWVPDGRVQDMEGRGTVAAQGDPVNAKISGEVKKRQRYVVYRRSGPTEDDVDKMADFVQKIGLIEIVRKASDGVYRAVILKSADAVQAGDLLKRED